jgi:hypothetical protein
MVLGLPDPNPKPDPDQAKTRKTYCFVPSFILKNFCKCTFKKSMAKIAGSESGSISQRHGSADPDPYPHQNVMDPQHCFIHFIFSDAAVLKSLCLAR